jgi:hypothetical protein
MAHAPTHPPFPPPQGQVEQVGGRQFKDVWRDRLKEAMGQSYYMVKSVHMGQIRLLLFARNDIYAAIK